MVVVTLTQPGWVRSCGRVEYGRDHGFTWSSQWGPARALRAPDPRLSRKIPEAGSDIRDSPELRQNHIGRLAHPVGVLVEPLLRGQL